MRHLMENLKKKRYHCNVFTNHMWPAAKAYTTEKYHYHLSEINEASPEAIAYLEKDHKQLLCKVSSQSYQSVIMSIITYQRVLIVR
jgi:hypothetical protein